MKNRKTVARLFMAWGIILILLIVCVRGIGILGFQKKQIDISSCIAGMESVIQEQDVYRPQHEEAYLLFDFGEIVDHGVYGISMHLSNYIATGKFGAYFGNEIESLDNEERIKAYIDKRSNEMTILSPKSAKYLKMYFDKPIDITKLHIVIQCEMTQIYVIVVLLSLFLSIPCTFFGKNKKKKIIVKGFIQNILNRKNKITGLIIITGLTILCIIEATCYVIIRGARLNPLRVIMFGSVLIILTFAVRYKKYIYTHFWIFYFFLLLMAGTINVISPPTTLDLSWDDQIHYERANYISRGFHHYETEAQYQLNEHALEMGSMRKENFSSEKRQELSDYIYSIEKNNEYNGLRRVKSYKSKLALISYIPTAIGLIIGRGLGMPAIWVLLFGKWVNLICYAWILSYSVYLLKKRGYIIVSFIGLIPPAVFLASSYSYDWWLTALIILGYALFEHEMQEQNEINIKTMIKIIMIMSFAVLPKPVYFPLLLPMLIACRDKKNHIKKSFWIIVVVMAVTASLFLIPSLLKGNHLNDTRGSLEVDSFAQIHFILVNPLVYAKIMFQFIWDYISPDHHDIMFGFMTAYGEGKLYSVVLILIVLGTFVDNTDWDDSEKNKIFNLRVLSAVGIFMTLILISTAFYVAYTAVMSDKIDGVQYRYSIPLLFPFLYYICRIKVLIPEDLKNKIALVGNIIMVAVLYYNIYIQGIRFY